MQVKEKIEEQLKHSLGAKETLLQQFEVELGEMKDRLEEEMRKRRDAEKEAGRCEKVIARLEEQVREANEVIHATPHA